MTDRIPAGDARPLAVARVVSLAEAVSFLLLLVATAVKYGADQPTGVRVLGPIHGTLFIAYCVLIVYVAAVRHWRLERTAVALVASVLPVAPILVERRWLAAETASPAATPVTPATAAGSAGPRPRPEPEPAGPTA